VIKFLIIFLFVLSNCSSIKKESKVENTLIKEDNLKKNFNSNIEINLNKIIKTKSFRELKNNYGRRNIQIISYNEKKYKIKKIKNFQNFEPNIIFDEQGFVFFESKGTILKYDYSGNLIWKKNYYSKQEKKSKILINFSLDNKNLIVYDNISKYYKINLETGELIWMKRSPSKFNSQIKIFDDKFYAVNSENVIFCISLINGEIIWNYKTENFFIKSNKKLSIIIDNRIVVFSNSMGDITALNAYDGSFLWQTPTQNNKIYAESISLSTSDLVLEGDSIFFSNNKNEFYSLNKNNGFVNWKQLINSDIRPILTEKILFTVSIEGILFVIDSVNGNILKSQDLFRKFKKKKRGNLKPSNILMGEDNLFMTLNDGRMLIFQINNLELVDELKLDNNSISEMFVYNQKIYLAKDNSIIELR